MGLKVPNCADDMQGSLQATEVKKAEEDEENSKHVCLEKTLIFEQESASSLAGANDLPPSWAWAGTQSENVKENVVNVIFGQSVR